MRFSVDAHAIGQHLTGNETYIRNLLMCFAALIQESEFIAYVSRASAYARCSGAVSQSAWWLKIRLCGWVRSATQTAQDRPDLLHVQYTAPLFCPVPVVVSVHDVSYLEYPEYFTPFRASSTALHSAANGPVGPRVFSRPASFLKRSIVEAYGLDPDKGDGDAERGFVGRSVRCRAKRRSAGLRTSQDFAFPFILSVGDLQPRKNHLQLDPGFRRADLRLSELAHHLVLVGKETWYSQYDSSRRERVGARTAFIHGFVEDEELLRLYGACDIFVYPSFYEGFGFRFWKRWRAAGPWLAPTLLRCRRWPIRPRLLFDPDSVPEMVRAMRDLLLDAELRARMERLGTQRATLFSWEQLRGRLWTFITKWRAKAT